MYGPDFITRPNVVNQPDLFGPITCMQIGCNFNTNPVTKELKQCWAALTAHYAAEPTHNPYSRSAFCHLLLSWLTTRALQADRLLTNATTFARANDLVLKQMYLPPIPADDSARQPAYPAVVATAHGMSFIHLQPLPITANADLTAKVFAPGALYAHWTHPPTPGQLVLFQAKPATPSLKVTKL